MVWPIVVILLFSISFQAAQAAPIPLVNQGQTTYDPNTNLIWADMGLSGYRSFDDVQANLLGPLQPLDGFRYATVAEVNQLFIDAGITVFTNHGADSAILALIGLLGATFLPGPELGFVGLGGMTADGPDPSHVFVMILTHTSDTFNGSFAGLAGAVSKFQQPAADGHMSFLVMEAVTRPDDISAQATPLPAALPLFATGLGALGLLGWRRKRKQAA
jgi:hypothetical protein